MLVLLSQRMHFILFCHGMQELAPHTSPIFVSAFRLLPHGVALVAWAAANGRQQPKGWQAWFACALFGLVDGTAFQVLLSFDSLLPLWNFLPPAMAPAPSPHVCLVKGPHVGLIKGNLSYA